METIRKSLVRIIPRLAPLIGAILLFAAPHHSSGKDISSMYEEKDLSRRKVTYSENISWNFENLIKPSLVPEELMVLENVNLEFPLIGSAREPFEYYAKVENGIANIVIPIFSVKFLDDLTMARAWLFRHSHSLEIVQQYVATLKYKKASEFPAAKYPPPLEALQIAENALQDRAADDIARDQLKLITMYVVCRELGHLYLNRYLRPHATVKEHTDHILQSDAFAMEILRRIGVPPIGLGFYFEALSAWRPNRGDFSDENAYQEYLKTAPDPVFPERLNNLADLMIRGKNDFTRGQVNRRTVEQSVEAEARYILSFAPCLESAECFLWKTKLAWNREIPGEAKDILIYEVHLPTGQYIEEIHTKTLITLHLTFGTSAESVYSSYTSDAIRVATQYVIEKDGSIYQFFEPHYWAYSLGIKGQPDARNEKRNIAIAIVNEGPLKRRNDTLYWWPPMESYRTRYCHIDEKEKYVDLTDEFRDRRYWAAVTEKQYDALVLLLKYLTSVFTIPRRFLEESERYVSNPLGFDDFRGILSHANFRADKYDIGPAFDWDRVINGVMS